MFGEKYVLFAAMVCIAYVNSAWWLCILLQYHRVVSLQAPKDAHNSSCK